MDWREIEAALQRDAEAVARHLLPNGKRDGQEWVCGSLDGQAGRSLKVNIGGKAGVWSDFADSGKGGKTLTSLWLSVRQQVFKVGIVEIKEFLGIKDDFKNRQAGPYPARPTPPTAAEKPEDSAWQKVADTWKQATPLAENGPVWKYLVEKRRLDPDVLGFYDVREMLAFHKWRMVFPYYPVAEATTGKVTLSAAKAAMPAWLKLELLERPDGKKKEWTSPAPEKSLFGVQLAEHPLFRGCADVLICEGEKDALAWATYGLHRKGILPVSVPFGAKWKGSDKGRPSPNREWLDRNWDWLQGFQTVFVAMDADEPGQRAAEDIINEIGPRRCRLVTLPHELPTTKTL